MEYIIKSLENSAQKVLKTQLKEYQITSKNEKATKIMNRLKNKLYRIIRHGTPFNNSTFNRIA